MSFQQPLKTKHRFSRTDRVRKTVPEFKSYNQISIVTSGFKISTNKRPSLDDWSGSELELGLTNSAIYAGFRPCKDLYVIRNNVKSTVFYWKPMKRGKNKGYVS